MINFEFFKLKKSTSNCLVWQLGVGLTRDITDNISVDIGAKTQAVNDIKLQYDTFNITTGVFESQKPIKKTIGVGEFTVGFTFKLPN